MEQFIQIVGALLVLAAFLLAQFDILDARTLRYLWSNAIGSTAMAITAVVTGDWGFVFLEGVWALVSYVGIVQRLVRGPAPHRPTASGGEAAR